MFKKINKNHTFRTLDTILVLVLLATVAGVSGSIVNDALRDNRSEQARFGAETLAHQIIASGEGVIRLLPQTGGTSHLERIGGKPQLRGPASVTKAVGSTEAVDVTEAVKAVESEKESHFKDGWVEGNIGRDPWGKPFRFKMLQGREGGPLRILVWSQGPNARFDTQLSDVEWAQLSFSRAFQFHGDDIGYAYMSP